MGSRFRSRDTTRIELGGGDWVELRPLSFSDRRFMQVALLALLNGEIALTERALAHDRANKTLMLRVVAAWGGPGFCVTPEHSAGHDVGACVPAPIDEEHIEELGNDHLLAVVDRFAADGRSRSDPKVSSPSTSQPSQREAEAAPKTTKKATSRRRRS